jgi:hypothetical protein
MLVITKTYIFLLILNGRFESVTSSVVVKSGSNYKDPTKIIYTIYTYMYVFKAVSSLG